MADDLVTRLIDLAHDGEWCSPLAQEAADELDKLYGALEAIRWAYVNESRETASMVMHQLATAALGDVDD